MPDALRDQWGRYKLPHPVTGQEQSWTRATTFADTLEDSYGITLWKQRCVALGVAKRPDLLALAQSLELDADKKNLDNLCKSALEAVAAGTRANLGTALHKMAERLDRGDTYAVPKAQFADMEAYQAVKDKHGIETHPKYIERITVVPEVEVAGTLDRIVRYKGKLYIADLKTGKDLHFGWNKIAVQLALYSRGAGLFNPAIAGYDPMPKVDQERGIVIHVPAGEGRAELHWVDIEAGWEAAQLCWKVRNWRKHKGLSERFGSER